MVKSPFYSVSLGHSSRIAIALAVDVVVVVAKMAQASFAGAVGETGSRGKDATQGGGGKNKSKMANGATVATGLRVAVLSATLSHGIGIREAG
jgi:hypothetical protein